LRTILIIAKDRKVSRHYLLPALVAAALAAGIAAAQTGGSDAAALTQAKREAAEAVRRSELLQRQASAATDEAARARARAETVAARIEAAEADITAAEARIRIVEKMRAAQRARLAERQGPVVRLTAALQTLARRPPALALVQPGSLNEAVRVRALLASTLPVVRARTAALRAEVARGNQLRGQAELAVKSLERGQADLLKQRQALAQIEAGQRRRSQALASSALVQSDRALALGEDARDLAEQMDSRQYQSAVRRSLAELPGPTPRPGETTPPRPSRQAYILPVEGRIVTGLGEISAAGVHARGLTFETRAGSPAIAPRAGRVAYAGAFRGYGDIVIIDHGGGWTTVVTDLTGLTVRAGVRVAQGAPLGRVRDKVTVELRRQGRPYPIAGVI
jgi:septal ring factor EnvC (AmiA/AmiB activator)